MMRLDRVKRVAMLPLSSVSTLRAQAAKEKAPKRQRRSINSGQATRFQRVRATVAAHVVAAWRVIHSFNSPSPVTNVQPVYAATISAREDDADTMTAVERDSRFGIIDTLRRQTTTLQRHFIHHRRTKSILTLNQTPQAPDIIQTRPTLRRSAVGRGKLRASRRSLLQASSTA